MKNDLGTKKPPTAVRLLDRTLSLCFILLALVTAFTVIWGFVDIGSGATLEIEGSTQQVKIEHEYPSGLVGVTDLTAGHSTQFDELDPTLRDQLLSEVSDVTFTGATASVELKGVVPRLIVLLTWVSVLAAAWVALLSLRGITASALAGETFTNANAARLTRVGWAILAYPFVWVAGRWLFNEIVDEADVAVSGFTLDLGIADGVLWAIVGLFILTLARTFRWGVELQEFEQAAI